MLTDAELLHRYVAAHAEDAFAELVRRHLNLVYAAALRRTNGRHALAGDIAQKVFVDLARKAAQLTNHPTLTGWLYCSTRYAAIDAIRVEQRREKLADSLIAMPDELSPAESPADWEQLRPVIDAAMDQLKEQDREIMLLRFFQGLSFAEVGAKLNLTENTARMRTERALEKLRFQLGKRGITSTAALAGLLTSQSLVAAPASLAASVTTAALATAPAGALATFFTNLLINKIALTSLSAGLAAGLTSVAWAALTTTVSDTELATLRAENARLAQATAVDAPAVAVNAVADEFAAQASLIVQSVGKRLVERNAAGTGQHHNHGQVTPYDALLSHAWASDTGDVAALAKILTYDEKGWASIRTIHAGMPAAIRVQYPTPEELMAFFFIADTLLYPVPGEEVVATNTEATELAPGRVTLHRPGTKPGGMIFVQTAEGWKNEVPSYYPAILAPRILGHEMVANLNAR